MKLFASLVAALELARSDPERIDALAAYLATAPDPDRLAALALLSGQRPKRAVQPADLQLWAAEAAGLPDWLIAACNRVVGDLAETAALILSAPDTADTASLADWITRLDRLAPAPAETRQAALLQAWRSLDATERLLLNKLVTGTFRLSLSPQVQTAALARLTGLSKPEIAQRLARPWAQGATTFSALLHPDDPANAGAAPYPFAPRLATLPLSGSVWHADWVRGGLLCQMVRRHDRPALWSAVGDLITDRFPELAALMAALPDGTVLEGEILARSAGHPVVHAALGQRLTGHRAAPGLVAKAAAVLVPLDVLEWQGADIRQAPLEFRLAILASLHASRPGDPSLHASQTIAPPRLTDLVTLAASARPQCATGVLLRREGSPYPGAGNGEAWHLLVPPPLCIRAVLLYATAPGPGSTGFGDCTFALPDGPVLLPVARINNPFAPNETADLAKWLRANTIARFGPVRQPVPDQVFDIEFQSVLASSRHKSGLLLLAPRVVHWHRAPPMPDPTPIADLRALVD